MHAEDIKNSLGWLDPTDTRTLITLIMALCNTVTDLERRVTKLEETEEANQERADLEKSIQHQLIV